MRYNARSHRGLIFLGGLGLVLPLLVGQGCPLLAITGAGPAVEGCVVFVMTRGARGPSKRLEDESYATLNQPR
jgi:hypothetical protein